MNKNLYDLSVHLGKLLSSKNYMLVTAESCTGGLVASSITSVAGSSKWFERAYVSYSNAAKQEMLDVSAAQISLHGAVSQAVVKDMAAGALIHSHADIAVAITGIAGPDGGSKDKPVGTVWFAWAGLSAEIHTSLQCFAGDRLAIQEQAALYAMKYLVDSLKA